MAHDLQDRVSDAPSAYGIRIQIHLRSKYLFTYLMLASWSRDSVYPILTSSCRPRPGHPFHNKYGVRSTLQQTSVLRTPYIFDDVSCAFLGVEELGVMHVIQVCMELG